MKNGETNMPKIYEWVVPPLQGLVVLWAINPGRRSVSLRLLGCHIAGLQPLFGAGVGATSRRGNEHEFCCHTGPRPLQGRGSSLAFNRGYRSCLRCAPTRQVAQPRLISGIPSGCVGGQSRRVAKLSQNGREIEG